MNEELLKFVEWLPNNSKLFDGLDTESVIKKINELSSSKEGAETLEQLTNVYKDRSEVFKGGGKLRYLLCLKNGGKGPDCGCNKVAKSRDGNSSVGYTDEQRRQIKRGMYSNTYTDLFGNSIEEYSGEVNPYGDPFVYSRLTTPDGQQLYSVKGHDAKTIDPFYGYERQYFEEDPDSKVRQGFDRSYERFNREPLDADKLNKTMNEYGQHYLFNQKPTSNKNLVLIKNK